MTTEWLDRPMVEIIAGLRENEICSTALLDEAEARHARYGNALNAYRVWRGVDARATAADADAQFKAGRDNGLLQGIPVSVKDLYGIGGFDTFAGSPRALPPVWEREGPIIAGLRREGAVITGKTHMVEFAFGAVGTNAHWPAPRNPWDTQTRRVPGGSSSGAGVSLAEGSAVIALGSDTAGSVRIPASITGTVGFKPSAGRWPTDGLVPLSPTFDVPGVLARSVADAAIAFAVIESELSGTPDREIPSAAELSGIVIGRMDAHFWPDCSPGVAEQVERALGELAQAGIRVVTTELPGVEEAFELFRDGGLAAAEFRSFIQSELPDWLGSLDPNVAARMEFGPLFHSATFKRRRARFVELAAAANDAVADIDVFASPTVPISAPTLAEVADHSAYAAANIRIVRNTCIANLLGFCALTIPVGLDSRGLPVGLQLLAKAEDERQLFQIGLAMEKCLGAPASRLGTPKLLSPA